jgi:hypothetical protein
VKDAPTTLTAAIITKTFKQCRAHSPFANKGEDKRTRALTSLRLRFPGVDLNETVVLKSREQADLETILRKEEMSINMGREGNLNTTPGLKSCKLLSPERDLSRPPKSSTVRNERNCRSKGV